VKSLTKCIEKPFKFVSNLSFEPKKTYRGSTSPEWGSVSPEYPSNQLKNITVLLMKVFYRIKKVEFVIQSITNTIILSLSPSF